MDIHKYFTSSINSEELWQRLHTVLAQYGVTHIFYGVGHLPDLLGENHLHEVLKTDTGLHSFHLKTSFAPELNNTEGQYHLEKDISALHCLLKTTPFIWDSHSDWVDDETREERKLNNVYWYDLKMVGASIPLRFGDFGKGGIGLSMSKLSGSEFDDMWAQSKDEIIRIVRLFDELVRAHYLDLIGIDLTSRDKDILAWIAEGHSAKVIADQLGTKQNTVQNQVVNLRKKLTARNNVQLITKAVTFKLI